MKSPVIQALINATMQEQDIHERAVDAAVIARLDLPTTPGDKSEWPVFNTWCEQKALTPYPARPATVAFFILDHVFLGIDRLLKVIESISVVHQGLADPTLSPMVSSALDHVAPIAPPRSWPPANKLLFTSLPRPLQSYLVDRESQRDTEVRRAQNKAAEARKALAATQQSKVKPDGFQSQSAA